MSIGPVDILILVVLAIGLILGFVKGFVRQITGLSGLIGGAVAAYFVYGWIYLYVAPTTNLPVANWMESLVVAVIAFVLVGLIFGVLGRAMQKALKTANLSGLDRTVGAGLGLAKSVILILLVLMFLMITPLKEGIINESRVEPVLRVFTGITVTLMDYILGSSPEQRVLNQLEYWGFDRKSCDKILKDPGLVFALAKSPRFFQRPIRDQKAGKVPQVDYKMRAARKKVMQVIEDTSLTAHQKANRILELLNPKST